MRRSIMKTSKKQRRSWVDDNESFDAFLAKQGLLGETEDVAIKEIIADLKKRAGKQRS
jgi:hypothetical protein